MISYEKAQRISSVERVSIEREVGNIKNRPIEKKANDITVVLPNYNNGHILEKVIESIEQQEDITFQLRIADNNSTDRSWDIIQEFQRTYTIDYPLIKFDQGLYCAPQVAMSPISWRPTGENLRAADRRYHRSPLRSADGVCRQPNADNRLSA